jgi:hypothetical protein
MRQVVAVFPQILDRLDVIRVEGFHEIAEVEEAGLDFIGPRIRESTTSLLEKARWRSIRAAVLATSTGLRVTHRLPGFGTLAIGARGATRVRGKDGVHPEIVGPCSS